MRVLLTCPPGLFATAAFGQGDHGGDRWAWLSSVHHFSIHHAPNSERIGVFQLVRQSAFGKSLVADQAGESEDCVAADRSRAAIGGRRIGSSVHHSMTNFNSGWKAVEHDAAHLSFENPDEIGEIVEVLFGAMDCGGQVAL